MQASWGYIKIPWSLATDIHKQYGVYFEYQRSCIISNSTFLKFLSRFEQGTFRFLKTGHTNVPPCFPDKGWVLAKQGSISWTVLRPFCALPPIFEKLFTGVERALRLVPNFYRAISIICAMPPTFMKSTPGLVLSHGIIATSMLELVGIRSLAYVSQPDV